MNTRNPRTLFAAQTSLHAPTEQAISNAAGHAIEVKNLFKKFVYYSSQWGRFTDFVQPAAAKRGIDVWALQDINLHVPKGLTVGIIGQNGSGKSTLLSILAGVLQPTSGTYIVNGKVASILELGSGFHHEFTARENVYMYGAIIGLSKQKIDQRFNEIVDFSELNEWIDRPLYTYSSGMVVRLAFATAVSVDADVLIIDEALSVGDALFQHKCFSRIRELKKNGKTILYVGHDLSVIRTMCEQVVLLDSGRIVQTGDSNTVVNAYRELIVKRQQMHAEQFFGSKERMYSNMFKKNSGIRFGTGNAEILNVELYGQNNCYKKVFAAGEQATLKIHIKVHKDIKKGFNAGFIVRNRFEEVYGTNAYWLGEDFGEVRKGECVVIEFSFLMNLGWGTHTITAIAVVSYSHKEGEILDWANDIYSFEILQDSRFDGPVYLCPKASMARI